MTQSAAGRWAAPVLISIAVSAVVACGGGRRAPAAPAPSPSVINREIPNLDMPSACPGTGASASAVGQGTDKPEVIFRASVSAQEVRFASQPDIRVRLCGGVGDTLRVIERRNLPKPVIAGRTYRNVYVSIEILAHLVCASTADSARTSGSSQQCTSLSIGAGAGAAPVTRPPPESRP